MENLASFTDILSDEIDDSQPISLSSSSECGAPPMISGITTAIHKERAVNRPSKHTGQYGEFRSVEEIDPKYRGVFTYPYFNLVQSKVIEDALYSDKSMVVCAPTGSGKTVVFEMAIVQLLMQLEDKNYNDDFKIIYMAPVKALCTERLTEWYPKFTKLGLLCIEVTGDTDVDFSQLKPYRIIITTPEKWDMLTRRWRDHRSLVEVIKLFLIDEVHILNDESRGPVLESVVSRMKTIQSSAQSAHRIEQLQKQYQGGAISRDAPPIIRFIAVSATVGNPEDVATWLGTADKPAVYHKFGDECRPVKLKRVVEGYPCAEGTSIFKFDIILNYKLWPIIQRYHDGKPTLIFCNTRKSVILTAETLSREITINFNPEQKSKLTSLASTMKNKKLQSLILSGVGIHHAGLLYEERMNIELAFRNRDLPILITTTTLAMGVNLPAHLVIIKNTQQYVNGAYQEYSISTVLQMVGRAGRPQYDTDATAVIMTRSADKPRYQALVGGSDPLQSFLHKRLAENLNSEAALGTVCDVAQCVQWLTSTFLCVRAARDPKRYLGLLPAAPQQLISKKIEELCVKAMNGLASAGLITMDEACCIESTEAGRLMSIYYLDLETMKLIMKINGTETLEQLLKLICDSHELSDMHLRMDERRCLNALNRNNAAATIRFPMKGKITTRQMKLNCIIQAILGCLPIPDPSLNQEAMKIMRIADRICKCLVAYVTRPDLISQKPPYFSAILNSLLLAKCVAAHLWENSPYVSKQLKGIGPAFSNLLATAGKVNFMLLEESHPRDLERIMNKGPPAGNVIRKQISLLPKYHISMTPVDKKTVTVQLVLLNQSHLAENLDHLTVGNTHRCHLVVGDSENYLLHLISFKDKDLISVYDGTITYEITRRHSSEHKIFAHCVSSDFVGIDAQCEYMFKDLEPIYPPPSAIHDDLHTKKATIRQTNITDSFKERKRRNTSDSDITQSKEKKKRDSALIEKFKHLKQSFGKTSKQLKKDSNTSAKMSDNILNGHTEYGRPDNVSNVTKSYPEVRNDKDNYPDIPIVERVDSEESMNDEKINNILKEIETEITNFGQMPISGNLNEDTATSNSLVKNNDQNTKYVTHTFSTKSKTPNRNPEFTHTRTDFTQLNINKRKCQNVKSNYSFKDILQKNMEFSDDEENNIPSKDSGFSDTIKSEISKYLKKTQNASKVPDKTIEDLLKYSDDELPNVNMDGKCENSKNLSTNLTSKVLMTQEGPKIETQHHFFNEDCKAQGSIETYHDKDKQRTEIVVPNLRTNNPKGDDNITDKQSQTEKNKYQLVPFQKDTPTTTTLYANSEYFMDKRSYVEKDNSLMKDTTANALIPNINADAVARTDNTEEEKAFVNYIDIQSALRNYCLESKNSSIISNNATVTEDNCATLSAINPSPECLKTNVRNMLLPVSPDHTYHNTSNTTDNQHKYTKRYSYTTTKIDVCTKNTPEHVIHIIRKLKVDLDVTEIVSKEDRALKGTKNLDEENNKHKFIDTPSNAKYDEKKANKNFNKGGTKIQTIRNMNNNNDTQYFSSDQTKFNSKDETHIGTLANNKILKQIKNAGNSDNTTKGIESNNIFEGNDTKNVINNTKEDKVTADFINLSSIDTLQQLPAGDSSGNTINNKIARILQKYSKLQRINNLEDMNQNTGLKIRDCNNHPTEKPKRPFKISEIDYYQNFKLPATIIKEPPRSNNDAFIPIKTNTEAITKEQIEQCDDIYTNTPTNPVVIDEEIIKENTKDPIPESELSNIDFNDETNVDLNIDESMFDPKTLLQCLGKDDSDEIIPPPPQFCDDTLNYSPQYENYSQINGSNPTSWPEDNEMAEYHNSVFLDNDINLTSSKEIETWALSREDSWEERRSQENHLVKYYTVTQKKSPTAKTLFQSVAASRNKKLGQFKFNHKDKLKLKM